MFSKLFGALISLTLLAGCAIGNKIDYRGQKPPLSLTTQKTIAVGVQDQRPYVVSGDKSVRFVGLQRGGFGNPFDVLTESGAPLAEDFSAVIASALRGSGATVQLKVFSANEPTDVAIKNLLALDADKFLMVTFHEWKSDTMMNVALSYDVTARVLDEDGNLLAQSRISGRENLGGSFLNPPAQAAREVPIAFSKNLGRLLSDEDLTAALN